MRALSIVQLLKKLSFLIFSGLFNSIANDISTRRALEVF